MNYYLTGIEGMQKLLDCCGGDPLKYFKKQTYVSSFQKMYQEHFGTFDAIENGYNMVIDKDQFLTHMANALTAYAAEQMNACVRKNQKERLMIDLNMTMAVFVLPMVLEYRGNSSKLLADKLVEAWKVQFPKSAIEAADFEYIEKGFHKKFCYITTAVCETLGKPDDCYELMLLRDYRDTYLAARPDGDALIQEYYDVAPSIVKHINQQENAQEIYSSICADYLNPCIQMIEEERMEECCALYQDMVYTLRDKYFYH